MDSTAPRAELLGDLRVLLRDLFIATEQGVAQARLARAHGYTDGFMKALLRAGLVTQPELLAIVQEERRRIAGPATRSVPPESDPGPEVHLELVSVTEPTPAPEPEAAVVPPAPPASEPSQPTVKLAAVTAPRAAMQEPAPAQRSTDEDVTLKLRALTHTGAVRPGPGTRSARPQEDSDVVDFTQSGIAVIDSVVAPLRS
ncbi:MAG: hypothetical protein HY909_06430 [Deltaproteobacteria bacterium]|nr:hypothetical protein [Deltaproteobacteria bacterium]